MSSSRKRCRSPVKFSDLEKSEPSTSATLHGVVNSLSPIKKGRRSKYFEGSMSDGKTALRFVGFSEKQQVVLEQFLTDRKPLTTGGLPVEAIPTWGKVGNSCEIKYTNY